MSATVSLQINPTVGGGAFQTPAFEPTAFLEDANAGWVDISADLTSTAIQTSRGFQSSSPDDLVSAPMTLQFSLNNSAGNFAGLRGYYSPDSPTKRTGWATGLQTRLLVTANGNTRTRFSGWLESIAPKAGLFADQTVDCVALSWLNQASTASVDGLGTQILQRGDQIVAALVALVPFAPPATALAVGVDTYPYAGDDLNPQQSSVLDGLDSVAKSGLDRIWEKADGTLVFESRITRATRANASLVTVTDVAPGGSPGMAHTDLPSSRVRGSRLTKVQVTVHPKRVDLVPAVLYATQVTATPPIVPANGGTMTFQGNYVDPNQAAQQIGGFNMLISDGGSGSVIGTTGFLPTSDFTITTQMSGLGTDISSQCTVAVTFTTSQVVFVITNNATQDGIVARLQARGQGIYDYQVVTGQVMSPGIELTVGRSTYSMDCPYQADPLFAFGAAGFILNLQSQDLTQVSSVSLFVHADDEVTMDALLQREVSDPISLSETVTGMAALPYWIDAVQESFDERTNLTLTWSVEPRDQTSYWLIGVAGFSEIGSTTTVAYV